MTRATRPDGCIGGYLPRHLAFLAQRRPEPYQEGDLEKFFGCLADYLDTEHPFTMCVSNKERCVVLARRRGWTNATLADRCAPAAGRVVTHQMVSEVLRPRVRRSNMSGKVRAALIAEIERVVGDGR